MTTLIAFIIGAFVGTAVGFFACAVVSVNRPEGDIERDNATSREPTRRLTECGISTLKLP
jgi:hypothetical protein